MFCMLHDRSFGSTVSSLQFCTQKNHRRRRPSKWNADIYVCKPLNGQTGLMKPVAIMLLLKHEFDVNNTHQFLFQGALGTSWVKIVKTTAVVKPSKIHLKNGGFAIPIWINYKWSGNLHRTTRDGVTQLNLKPRFWGLFARFKRFLPLVLVHFFRKNCCHSPFKRAFCSPPKSS